MTHRLKETTIRDFGGGWDLSDSDKSLSSRYQTESDNVIRGTDGHFRTRYGYKLFAWLRKGVATTVPIASFTVATTNGSSVVKITKNAHGYVSGQHVDIKDFNAALNGITVEMMERYHGIVVNDANNFSIYVRGVANGTGTAARDVSWIHDTHVMGSRDIFGRYYKDNLIVFSENGEIAAVNINGLASQVWTYSIANSLTLEPWSYCRRVSAEIVRGRLIAVNGQLNDKPLAIDGTTVNYLVDASSLSNAAIPRAEFVIAASQYIILINTEYGPTKLEIGARNTVGTFSRNPSPDDAVEVDVGMMTQTVDSTILGASVIRSRVFIGFSDRSMLGTLGIYTPVDATTVHEPDFNDNIAEFGTFSHSAIISLGNDLFCPGMNGVNSLEISKASGEFVPQTVSDLIHPAMLRHFSRLTEDDRRYRTFAVFDVTSRSYLLFVPKYSVITADTRPNPFIVTSTLQPFAVAYLVFPNHTLDADDYITITGAVDYDANLLGSMFNGKRRIRQVINKDVIAIEVDPYPANYNTEMGGIAVKITPVNDETIVYGYEYNPRLKIRRWTRFRGLNFDWGARSQFNKMFFGKDGKIWHMGDSNNPFTADRIDEYDDQLYATSHAYGVGRRVIDSVDGIVYECLVAHTSDPSGTFAAARLAHSTYWQEFQGYEISWSLETAWTDFDKRKENKQIELVSFDTEGSAAFSFGIFTNDVKRNFEDLLYDPVVETDFQGAQSLSDFVGASTPGFGAGEQPYGGGRNTSQEWLHSMPAYGKLFKFRWSGHSIHPLKVAAVTLYYHLSEALT